MSPTPSDNSTPVKRTTTTTTTVVTTHSDLPPVVASPPPQPTYHSEPAKPPFSLVGLILSIISGLALLVFSLLAAAVAFVVFAGPGIIQKTIQEKTGFALKFTQFTIDPFQGKVTIKDLDLQNPYEFAQGANGQASFIKMPSANIQVDLGSVLDKNKHIHLNDLSLNFSDINLIRNSAGQTNAQIFVQRLSGSTPTTGDHPAATANQPATPTQPTPVISVDHLHLQVGNVSIVDLSSSPPQTTALPMQFDYERANIANVMDIRQDLTMQIISQSGFKLAPQAILSLSNTLMGSTTGAATLTKNTLQTGVNVTEQTTQKAAAKISSGFNAFKNIISNHGQTQP